MIIIIIIDYKNPLWYTHCEKKNHGFNKQFNWIGEVIQNGKPYY